jgi:ParB-like chromosome segregation protein Spo0J
MTELPVADIIAGDRHRMDRGDLAGLAKSIQELGLLHPLVVTQDRRLVAGARRLAAVSALGWATVPVRVVDNLADAAALLRAERDENTCRKEFTPTEAVAIGRALEELERPKAKARQKEHGGTAPGQAKNTGGKLPEVSSGDTRDKVAEAVGMSGRTYEKAKAVVEAAEADPELRAVADEMDRTGKVEPAFQKVKATRPAPRRGRRGRRGKEPARVAGACAELNRLVKSREIDRRMAQRLCDLLPGQAEQRPVVQAGVETIKRTVARMEAERDWLRSAEWWRERARAPSRRPIDRPEAAGPLAAADKERVLAALTEARDTLNQWIPSIESWPVASASD